MDTLQESRSCRKQTSITEALVVQRWLRYIGHVIRTPDKRFPRQILCGDLASGRRSTGGQKKQSKGHLNTTLTLCNIPPSSLEAIAASRKVWHAICQQAVDKLELNRTRAFDEAEDMIDLSDNPPNRFWQLCPTCGRRCVSDFGLRSLQESHRQRDITYN